MRKIAWPIYLLAISIILVIGMAGFVFYNDRQNDRQLAEAVVDRQRLTNETLRGICDRFELRDEIFLRILEQSAARQRALGNTDAVEELELNILALRLAQGDCLQDIPNMVEPPSVP
jgi:hypothetical protein